MEVNRANRRLRHLELWCIAIILAGCGTGLDPIPICTEIGCNSGITVVLETPPSSPYRIEVHTAGAAATRYVHQCESPSTCAQGVFFPDFTPDRVFVEVITATGTQRFEVAPTYIESRPNGPRCPPTCHNALVRISGSFDGTP